MFTTSICTFVQFSMKYQWKQKANYFPAENKDFEFSVKLIESSNKSK